MCLFSHALPLQITTNIRCHNNSSDTSLLFHCCVFSPCLLCAVHLRLLSRRTWVPCLFPSLTLSLFQSPQTLGGSDNKRRGEEKGTTVGAFHRHAKSFRGKPSQIFPTVCGKGLCFSCYSVPLRKLTVGESGAHTKTQVLSPNHLLWFTVQSTELVQLWVIDGHVRPCPLSLLFPCLGGRRATRCLSLWPQGSRYDLFCHLQWWSTWMNKQNKENTTTNIRAFTPVMVSCFCGWWVIHWKYLNDSRLLSGKELRFIKVTEKRTSHSRNRTIWGVKKTQNNRVVFLLQIRCFT